MKNNNNKIINLFLKKKIYNILKQTYSKKIIKIWSRNSKITKEFLGFKCAIHNGKIFKKVLITKDMLGFKFGEFALTRIPGTYKKKK